MSYRSVVVGKNTFGSPSLSMHWTQKLMLSVCRNSSPLSRYLSRDRSKRRDRGNTLGNTKCAILAKVTPFVRDSSNSVRTGISSFRHWDSQRRASSSLGTRRNNNNNNKTNKQEPGEVLYGHLLLADVIDLIGRFPGTGGV